MKQYLSGTLVQECHHKRKSLSCRWRAYFFQGVNKSLPWPTTGEPIFHIHVFMVGTNLCHFTLGWSLCLNVLGYRWPRSVLCFAMTNFSVWYSCTWWRCSLTQVSMKGPECPVYSFPHLQGLLLASTVFMIMLSFMKKIKPERLSLVECLFPQCYISIAPCCCS